MTEQAQAIELPPVKFNVTEAAIQKMETDYMALTIQGIEDKGGLALVHQSRMIVKDHRVAVDKSRKSHNNGAHEFIRHNNAAAKALTSRLKTVEAHLQAEEDRINTEKARLKEEADRIESERIQSRIDAFAAYGATLTVSEATVLEDESFERGLAHARTDWEAEQERLAEEKRVEDEKLEREKLEREAEDKRLAEERKKLDAEKAAILLEREAEALKQAKAQADIDRAREKQRIEQEEATQKLQDEKDRLEAEKAAIANDKRIEAAKAEAAAQAVRDEQARVEREAQEEEDRKRREAEEAARQEALKPDKEKLLAYADALDDRPIATPKLTDKKSEAIMIDALDMIGATADFIRREVKDL